MNTDLLFFGILLIPAAILLGSWWVSRTNQNMERESTADTLEQNTFNVYINRITGLVLERNLATSNEDDEIRVIARALTANVLRNVDAKRKGLVVSFLYDSFLLRVGAPVISLRMLDLAEANMARLNLSEASLQGTYLAQAKLSEADLSYSDLRAAVLSEADLSNAILTGAYLRGANLQKSHFQKLISKTRIFRGPISRMSISTMPI
jgi:uncharacterized protein YjbI with pentapeptide repeats